MQVGRLQPLEDAAAVLHIRDAVGAAIGLRAEANQKWALSQSLQFGHAVKGAGLQVGSRVGDHGEAQLSHQAFDAAIRLMARV